MSFWASLFGGSDLVDKVAKGVDASFFTQEEKARHYLEVLKNIEPFKLAQRWIAVVLVLPYVLVWLICAGLFIAAATADIESTASRLIQISDMLATRNNDNLGFPVSLVVGFYFAGGALEGIVAKWKK
jgi:hypothetical protein